MKRGQMFLPTRKTTDNPKEYTLVAPGTTIVRPHERINQLYEIYQNTNNGARLYISDIYSAKNLSLLRTHQIRAVVNACHIAQECQYQPEMDISYLNLDFLDGDEIAQQICHSLPFIHHHLESGNNVLVHCHAGISRSATIIASYILLYVPTFLQTLPQLEIDSSNSVKIVTYMSRIKTNIQPKLIYMIFLESLVSSWEDWSKNNCKLITRK